MFSSSSQRQIPSWCAVPATAAVLALALLLALAAPRALAQTAATGALAGAITDPSGAAVAGATLRLTSHATGEVRTARSAPHGTYLLPLLPPGAYTLTVARSGFATATVANLQVNVAETTTRNLRLQLGSASQTISVTAGATQLQTVSSALGRITDQRMIASLPLVSRNYTQILGLSPGVSGAINDASALGRGTTSRAAATGGYSVSGASTTDNNTEMNGIGVNDLMGAGYMSGGVPVPNPDAIQEFKVQTALYDASYGRNAGANVDVITKSGTNAFHGSAFEYLRNSALNANDFFLNASHQPRGVLDQNQFGFTLGGPIRRQQLFFFGSYQGTRQRDGLTSGCLTSGNLPVGLTNRASSRTPSALAQEFSGDTTFFGGSINSNSTISPTAISLLNAQLPDGSFLIPGAQNPQTGATILSSACSYSGDQALADLDWYPNASDHVAVRAFWANSQQTEQYPPNPFGFPVFNTGGFPQVVPTDARVVSLTWTHVVTPNLLNQAVVGVHRMPSAMDQQYPNVTYAVPGCAASRPGPLTLASLCAAGPASDNPYPAVFMLPSAQGGFNIGGWGQGQHLVQNFYTLSDSLSYTHGSHDLHFGAGLTRSEMNQNNFHFLGALVYPTFADFLLGNVLEAVDVPGLSDRAWRATNANAFLQDNLRLTPGFTLNLGLRYEFQGAIGDALGRQSTMNLAAVNPNPSASGSTDGYVVASNFSGPLPAGVTRSPNTSALDNLGQNAWEPRLGFAWQIFGAADRPGNGDGGEPTNGRRGAKPRLRAARAVLRGGFGMFATRSTGEPFVQLLSAPPFGLFRQITHIPLATPTTALPPAPTFPIFPAYSPSTALSPTVFSPDFQSARSEDYGLNLQTELARNWMLELGYHGAHATHLPLGTLFDQALDATPASPVRGLTTNTAANLTQREPYIGFAPSAALEVESTGFSWYNGFAASLSKRFSHGLQFLASYTWASSLSNDPSYTTMPRLGGQLVGNQSDPKANYGFDPFIRPQRLVISYLYDLPSPAAGTFTNKLLGGWQLSGVTTFQSGDWLTFTDTDANNAFLGAGANDFPDIAAGCSRAQLITPGPVASHLAHAVNTACFAAPPVITRDGATAFGTAGTSIARGPAQQDFDIALIKNIALNPSETRRFQLRGEFFNAFNTPSFADPDTNAGTVNVNASGVSTLALSNTFGAITSTSVNPRIIQLAAKFIF